MTRILRVTSFILALAFIVSLMAFSVSAASSKSGTNIGATVVTGKRPWYSILPATVTVKNDGSNPITVNVEDSSGRLVSSLTSLKGGKSHTFSLKPNSTYHIYWAGNSWGGDWRGKATITPGRYINEIR